MDDINNVIVNAQGKEDVLDLAKAVDKATQEVYEFGDVYELAGQKTKTFDDVIDEVVISLEALRKKQEQVTQSAKQNAAAMDGQGRAVRGMNIGQAAMEASRGLEDLQYGINGVVNNIPSLVMALGGTAGLAAVFSLVAIGINQLVKHWPEFMGLFTERNPVPEATDSLTRYKDALEKTTKELDALKGMTSLSNEETQRFNKLTAEQLDLQKKVTEETKKQADLKALLESRTKEEIERGKGFEEAAAGRGPRLQADLTAAQHKIVDQEVAEMKRRMDNRLFAMTRAGASLAELEAAAESDKQAIKGRAEQGHAAAAEYIKELMVDLKAGNKNAMTALKRMMDSGTGVLIGGEGFRAALGAASAEGKAAAKQAAEEAAEFDRNATETFRAQTVAAKKAEDDKRDRFEARLNNLGQLDDEKAKAAEDAAKAKHPDIARQLKAEDESIKAVGAVPVAASLLARAGAARDEGMQGFAGKTDDQIFAMVKNEVDKELRRRNPYMMGDERRDLATKITSEGYAELGKRMTGLNAAEATNTAKLLGVAAELDGEVAQIRGMVQAVARGTAHLQRQGRARRRTALPRG